MLSPRHSIGENFGPELRRLFAEVFQCQFASDRDVVDFYRKRSKSVKIPWEVLGERMGRPASACYKYFVNTFCKAVMEPWPAEILQAVQEEVDAMCQQHFPTRDIKQTKREIIDAVTDTLNLRAYKDYHFDTLYFRMYNRVEKNYREYEQSNICCKIPPELARVYSVNSLDLSELSGLALRAVSDEDFIRAWIKDVAVSSDDV